MECIEGFGNQYSCTELGNSVLDPARQYVCNTNLQIVQPVQYPVKSSLVTFSLKLS